MRPIAVAAALLASSSAWAGGIGLMLDAGMHTDKVYYYSDTIVPEGGGDAVYLDDPDLWEQYQLGGVVGHGGGGLEIVLGDRDDRIMGLFRFYYLADMAQADPLKMDLSDLDPQIQSMDTVHANVRTGLRHIGMGSVGLNWGIFGNPDTWQLGFTAQLGSGFLTTDHTEFIQANIGPMMTYKVARQVQLFGDLTFQERFRKGYSHGGNASVGVRYLFD